MKVELGGMGGECISSHYPNYKPIKSKQHMTIITLPLSILSGISRGFKHYDY